MAKKVTEPDYNAMLEYIVEEVGQTVAEEDDQRIIDEIISSNIPYNLTVEFLVKKLRDAERNLHYSGR